MKIVGYLITYNGISGHLEDAIECMDEICEYICVNVSERSDDRTLEWCRESGKVDVVLTEDLEWAEDEPEIRRMAYNRALKDNPDADWMMCLDDDEIIPEVEKTVEFLRNVPEGVDMVMGNMFHLWEDDFYRVDGDWKPSENNFTIFENLDSEREGKFKKQGIHGGRLPRFGEDFKAAQLIPVIHFGWRTSHEGRIRKIRRRNKSQNLDVQVERNILQNLFVEPELERLPEEWRHLV